jgi:hypothetical protein
MMNSSLETHRPEKKKHTQKQTSAYITVHGAVVVFDLVILLTQFYIDRLKIYISKLKT